MDVSADHPSLHRLRVRLLVLFGSRARAGARASSDLDLGVIFESGAPGDLDAIREALHAPAGMDVDLVDLGRADPLLLREAALDGRPLFEAAPGAFEEFRLRAVKRYYDTAWIRRAEAEALRRRLA
ncbi:MAG: nucleotidyltransferase domain-containing protein [Acidobacteria bacterium]|nr:nucleotidyltransferase domain-containing protein [Acidobacteriota bacterium]